MKLQAIEHSSEAWHMFGSSFHNLIDFFYVMIKFEGL
jgi:hypothetical protein